MGFLIRSHIKRAVQPKKMARDGNFQIKEVEGLHYVAKTKALISCTVTVQLIRAFVVFVFANAKSKFSHDRAHMLSYPRFSKAAHFRSFLILYTF